MGSPACSHKTLSANGQSFGCFLLAFRNSKKNWGHFLLESALLQWWTTRMNKGGCQITCYAHMIWDISISINMYIANNNTCLWSSSTRKWTRSTDQCKGQLRIQPAGLVTVVADVENVLEHNWGQLLYLSLKSNFHHGRVAMKPAPPRSSGMPHWEKGKICL
jgi:hypothetical protein